jgi:hypothetical protein
MVINGVINSGQSAFSLADVVASGNFSAGDFLEGLGLTGFAGQDTYTTGQDIDKYVGANASQELGQQVGSIAWDAASMFVPAPLRRLFAVGNLIEAGKEALSGNWLDAVQNLLTAGMQFAGVQGPKELGAKITATNPTLTKAVTELASDIPTSIRLKSNFKAAPAQLVRGKTPMVLQTKRQIAEQIQANTARITTNSNLIGEQLRTEASNLTAKAAQKAGSVWQHVSSNFNAGRRNIAQS